jgi:hypothetical protein
MQLLLALWLGGAAFKGRLISIQLGLVAVKLLLVSIQDMLGVRSVRVVDRLGATLLDSRKVEHKVIAKLVGTSLVLQP